MKVVATAAVSPASQTSPKDVKTSGKFGAGDLQAFHGAKVSMIVGNSYHERLRDLGIQPVFSFYQTAVDCILALRQGKVDAFVYDEALLVSLVGDQPDLTILPTTEKILAAYAINKDNEALAGKIDAEIKKLEASGTLDALKKKWLSPGNTGKVLPKLPEPPAGAPVLRAAVNAENMPFLYYQDGQLTGYEVELLMRLAQALGMRLELQQMDFNAVLPSLLSKRADIAASCLHITPERSQSVRFTVPTAITGMTMAIRTEDAAPAPVKPAAPTAVSASGKFGAGDLQAFHGAKVSMIVGNSYHERLRDLGIQPVFSFYQTAVDCILALRQGKVDAFVYDEALLVSLVGDQPDLTILPTTEKILAAYAINKDNEALAGKIDAEIKKLEASGTLDALKKKWLSPGNTGKVLPQLPAPPAGAPVLRAAVNAENMPFLYYQDGQLTGYEVELLMRLAQALGMRLELQQMDFNAVLPTLLSKRADIAASCLHITPERSQSVRFTVPTAITGMTMAIRTEDAAPAPVKPATPTAVSASGKFGAGDLQAFHGAKVSMIVGNSYHERLRDLGIQPVFSFYQTAVDCILALRQGKVDAFVYDEALLVSLVGDQPDLTILPTTEKILAAYAINKDNEALAGKIDAEIKKLEASGTLDALKKKWLSPGNTGKVLPKLPEPPAGAPVLRAAVNAENMPFLYYQDGQLTGYEVELLMRLAQALGMRLELQQMDFNAVLPSLLSKRADIAASCLHITPERSQSVRFTVPTAITGMTMAIRTEDAKPAVVAPPAVTTGAPSAPVVASATTDTSLPTAEPTFWEKIKHNFVRNLILENRWRMIVDGLWETIIISFSTLVLGTVMGVGVCAMRRSTHWVPRTASMVYIRILQGTPIVVILMIFYYILLANAPLSGTSVAILAFSCNFAAYVAEMFRTGLDALDKGQQEAGIALGFTRWQRFRHIISPQAARIVLPVFKGEFISTVKLTSVVGYIAVQDLTKASDLIRSRTYEPFFPLILTAIIYFCISYSCIILLDRLEAGIDPTRRKRRISGINESAVTKPEAKGIA